jgi:glycosyltransferase involved in cell wall biosynthesis
MRILQVAPLWETVPPPAYGGTEAVVSLLTDELVRRGHEVTLVASGDSTTDADLVSVYPQSLRTADDLGDRAPYDWLHIGKAMSLAGGFDIVHNHAGELAMVMAQLVRTPVLTTTHCLTTGDTCRIWRDYRAAYNTVSRSQRAHFRPFEDNAHYVGHVYNAVDVDTFPFQREKSDDLLFLSRIAPEKGPDIAIEVARRTGHRLIIAGKVDRVDRAFFEEVIRDQIDGEQIVFVGEADGAMKRRLYKDAKCVLVPLTWEEPFGLVMPESLACGTPVIAMRRGAAPEIIRDGVTGFLVDTPQEMADVLPDVTRIDPAACRQDVADRFSPESMADGYLAVYRRLLDTTRRAGSSIERTPSLAAAVAAGG